MAKYDERAIREVINSNFTFADLSPRFKGVDSSTGNIFCPFHDNHSTPASKMYWDEDRGIWVLWCFTEHRHFTAYDYVNLILCQNYGKYESPLAFLKANMSVNTLGSQLEFHQKNIDQNFEFYLDDKKTYIENTFNETGNIIDFIEKLYTA